MARLRLPVDIDTWYARAQSYPGVGIEPLRPEDAIAATRLPGDIHRDPTDRFIVCLARRLAVPLVTADERLRAYAHVETIW